MFTKASSEAICSPTACQADLLATATNMSPCGVSGVPDEYRSPSRICRRECCAVSRAGRRMKEESEMEGWSIRRCPTPGKAERTSIPISRRCPTGPMPLRSRMAGEWMAPEERITSLPRNSRS